MLIVPKPNLNPIPEVTMMHDHFNGVWVPKRAYTIADWLIYETQLQAGHGLAVHLGLNPGVDNHNAVRIWVHRQMQQWPPEHQTLGDLKSGFISLIPSELL